jgi:hypothetical protein
LFNIDDEILGWWGMFRKALLGAVCAISISVLWTQNACAQDATALERANEALAKGNAADAEAAFDLVLASSL